MALYPFERCQVLAHSTVRHDLPWSISNSPRRHILAKSGNRGYGSWRDVTSTRDAQRARRGLAIGIPRYRTPTASNTACRGIRNCVQSGLRLLDSRFRQSDKVCARCTRSQPWSCSCAIGSWRPDSVIIAYDVQLGIRLTTLREYCDMCCDAPSRRPARRPALGRTVHSARVSGLALAWLGCCVADRLLCGLLSAIVGV